MKLPSSITLKTSDIAGRGGTIQLRYSGPLRFRFWLARYVIQFAAWLMGATADVEQEATP